jgi:hypothetical protein
MGAFLSVILRIIPWLVTGLSVGVQLLRGAREIGSYVIVGFLIALGAYYGPAWVTALADLAFPNLTSHTSTALGTALGMANWMMPVVEIFGMLVVYIPLWIMVTFIRIYKSLIPTIG